VCHIDRNVEPLSGFGPANVGQVSRTNNPVKCIVVNRQPLHRVARESKRLDAKVPLRAKLAYRSGIEHKIDSPFISLPSYAIKFVEGDRAETTQLARQAAGKPGLEHIFLAQEALTTAYYGELEAARELSQQAVASARRGGEKEYAESAAAMALALSGETARVEALTNDLDKRFPEDTLLQFNVLPTIRAELALNRNQPSKAMELLRSTVPYELGENCQSFVCFLFLYPVEARAQAYFSAHNGAQAAAEFQRILHHRGIVTNEPIGALAHLGLPRAYAAQGDTAKARDAYRDFLTLWKDADPDIPVLKDARAGTTAVLSSRHSRQVRD
jgi:hypothetical protein